MINGKPIIRPSSDVHRILAPTNIWTENLSFNHKTNRQRINNPEFDDPESFYRAIGPILRIFQVFGIFPVEGIYSSSPNILSYKTRSLRTFYSFTIVILIALRFISCISYLLKIEQFKVHDDIYETLAAVLFFFHSQLGFLFFIWFSPRWIKLQQEWRMVEEKLDSSNWNRPRLRRKFKICSIIMLCFGVIDNTFWFVNVSSRPDPGKYDGIWREYSIHTYTDSNSTTSGFLNNRKTENVILMIIDIFSLCIWFFADLFIILVSIGLAERYESLNNTVDASMRLNHFEIDWLHVREKYTDLSHLVKQTDQYLSPLILLSFICNLFYMCLQLFDRLSLDGSETFLEAVSCFSTFVFVLTRTIAVTLSAARIHDKGKMILPILYKCPSSSFTIETKRLQCQLTSDEVALTGMNFFLLTRKFLVAVAGTLVTYEIVLLRLNSNVVKFKSQE